MHERLRIPTDVIFMLYRPILARMKLPTPRPPPVKDSDAAAAAAAAAREEGEIEDGPAPMEGLELGRQHILARLHSKHQASFGIHANIVGVCQVLTLLPRMLFALATAERACKISKSKTCIAVVPLTPC